MKILAIIPARYASTRFPGKPLVEINGKSMISLVYEQAKQVNAFSKIIIATDDERIFQHVKDFGGDAMITSADHQSGTDRCGEVIIELNEEFDIVINIQGDEPFIQPAQLELLLTAFNDPTTEIATLAKQISTPEEIENPNLVKVVFSLDHNALYFSRSAIPYPRNRYENYFKHIGIYAYRSEILKQIIRLSPTPLEIAESLEQLRWLENGYKIRIVETEIETTAIDTREDLDKLNLK